MERSGMKQSQELGDYAIASSFLLSTRRSANAMTIGHFFTWNTPEHLLFQPEHLLFQPEHLLFRPEHLLFRRSLGNQDSHKNKACESRLQLKLIGRIYAKLPKLWELKVGT
jgi:hypothetical protein